MGYNGWSNYETWCANLWLSNDQSTVWLIEEQIEFIRNGCTTDPDDQVHELEFYLDDLINNILMLDEENVSGLAKDLLTTASGEINTRELAKTYLDDYEDE